LGCCQRCDNKWNMSKWKHLMKWQRWPKRFENIKEVPRPTMQSMAKMVHSFNKPESWQRHLEVNSGMELAMEQMINQINHFNLHLLQPRSSKNRNLEKDLSIIQCYKCRKMKHYSKKCPNLLALHRKNVNSYTWNFFYKRKIKFKY